MISRYTYSNNARCSQYPTAPLPVLRHIKVIVADISMTWYQTGGICFYTYRTAYTRKGALRRDGCSRNFRCYLMYNIPFQIGIQPIIRRPGVTGPTSGLGHQLDAAFKVTFARTARVSGARKRDTDRGW